MYESKSRSFSIVVRPGNRKMVAFNAYLSNDLKSIAANTIIVFDKTGINVGNAYNTSNGVFTAPVDGVYAFHWTVLTPKGAFTAIYIQVNGQHKHVLFGDARLYPSWYSASQSYVTELKRGDRVNLITNGRSRQYVHDYSSFNGYRL
ncbi:hypothetical protein FSP39_010530 [Pinctada imbricata]|uniref:C1q domain-containing protein n=1 Tax=Pinctada imbricata TaxID=66713 RepID=A0AA88XR33_PINIB|nr:hypothetical protein FSP39_010530 [Pinctada imbricata]